MTKSSTSGRSLQTARFVVQALVMLFLNAKLIGFSSTSLIVPYLHSTQAPFSVVHGAFESLEYTISHGVFPFLVLGVIYLTAATVGKVYCGWACPIGAIQDWLYLLPIQKQRLSASTTSSLRDVKWAVVAFCLLTTGFIGLRSSHISLDSGSFADSPFSVISPSSTIFGYIFYMMTWKSNVLIHAGAVGWLKLIFMIAVLAPSLFVSRFFCRFICPMGALLEPLSKFKLLKITRSRGNRDEQNKYLNEICPTGVQVSSDENDFIDHPNCIHCGKCAIEYPNYFGQKFL